MVTEIANWGGLDLVHESSKKVAVRVIPPAHSVKDILANQFTSDGFYKAQKRILEREGFSVVEIHYSEWNHILKKNVKVSKGLLTAEEVDKAKKNLVTKKLREDAGIELDWIGVMIKKLVL